jgi:protein-tyrosine phosphatase
MQKLYVEGTHNVRDMGGYTTDDGKTTKIGMLIRSGNLDKLPEVAQQQLIDYGVKTIVDLRSEWEQKHYPNVFTEASQMKYYNLPLVSDTLSNNEAWQAVENDYTELHELYIKYLEWCQPQIVSIITTIADADSAIILHCHAGKDRTGIIAALLLSSVGVSDTAISQDYSLTGGEIPHLIAEWRDYYLSKGRDIAQIEREVATKPETMMSMLKYIEDTYGSMTAYLESCGVTSSTLMKLREKFLE